nr:tyrosine-protein phosphatase non-receptor type 13-like [Halyomorpha halys]
MNFVISAYCRGRKNAKPLSQVIMDMYNRAASQISSIPEVQDQPWFLEEKPMQKTISRPIFGRLYRQPKEGSKYCGPTTLIGPEFIIRGSEPTPLVHLGDAKVSVRRRVLVVLLNGQKIEITCDPSCTTVSDIFQVIVQREGLDHPVTLGLCILASGDFVFPPGEKKLVKIAPQPWPKTALTLYLRFRLYLPSLRGTRSWKWKHLLYLQLRRSLLERQLRAARPQLLALGGLALQAEFGDHSTVEKTGDSYFLVEHYLPENESGERELELLHRRRVGLDPGRAEEMFISHCTSLPEYGTHYISACVINKEGGSSDVWLGVNSKGVVMAYKRDFSSSVVRQPHYTFNWPDIKKLSYSKHYFDIISADAKYRLKLDSNKSSYFFHLAWLHHKFFMKLTNEYTTLQSLTEEFGDIKRSGKKGVLHVSPDVKRPTELGALRRAASLLSPDRAIFRGKTATHCLGTRSESCRENRTPTLTSTPLTHNVSSTLSSRISDSSDGGRSKGRRRPLMGTRAIFSNSQHDLHSSSSQASLELISPISSVPPYLLTTNIKCVDSKYHSNFQETISESLAEKFDKAAFLTERILNTIRLERASDGSLGLHVTEGKDGHVYVLSTVEGTPAANCGAIFSGDQIQAVNGIPVLNVSYFDVLKLIQNSGQVIELVLSQIDRGQPMSIKSHPTICKVSQETGIDMIGVLQKGIEASYLKTIRYEIAPETDSDIVFSTDLPRPISSYL